MLKKIQIYALLSILIFYFFIIQKIYAFPATPDPLTENFAELIINEVSFKNSEYDWIELYVLKKGTIKGLKIYDDSNFINIDDDIRVEAGDYILVYFKADEDLIGYNSDILVIQDTKNGLTGTTEQIALINYYNKVIDFVCWHNSSPTSGEIQEFDELRDENWIGNDIKTCIDSDQVSNSNSIARNNFYDTDSSEDWTIISNPTPGDKNEIFIEIKLPEIDIPKLTSEQETKEEIYEKIEKQKELISDQKICTKDIVISEILPNPVGSDSGREWVEIANIGSDKCVLDNWAIDDIEGGSTKYLFKNNLEIIPNGFILVPSWESKISLNNSDESVRLFKNFDELVDEISYETSYEDESFSRSDDEFFWTRKITPLTENIISKNQEIEQTEKDTNEKNDESFIPNGDLSNSIQISEIFPNPEGTDKGNEWVELYNDSEETVNLSNWTLDTGENSKTKYIFQKTLIGPHEHLLLSDDLLKFSLKNSNGEVRLKNFNNEMIDQIEYESAKQAESYAKIIIQNNDDYEFNWEWTAKLTPGKQNPTKQKINGEIIEFNEQSSVLSMKVDNSEEKITLNVLNDGVSDFKNTFIKGTKISAITLENENGQAVLDEYEVVSVAEPKEEPRSNNYLLYSFPAVFLITGLIYYLNKKYKIINFATV